MPDRVNEDEAYQNAKMHSDRQNAKIEHDAAVKRQVTAMLRDNTELYRRYTEDQAFQDDLNEMIFNLKWRNSRYSRTLYENHWKRLARPVNQYDRITKTGINSVSQEEHWQWIQRGTTTTSTS